VRKKEDYDVLGENGRPRRKWRNRIEMMASIMSDVAPEQFARIMDISHSVSERMDRGEIPRGRSITDYYDEPATEECVVVSVPLEDKPLFNATDQKHGDLESVLLGKSEDVYVFHDSSVVLSKNHRYVKTDSRYYEVPCEKVYLKSPPLKYPAVSADYYSYWKDLSGGFLAFNKDNVVRRDYVDRFNVVLQSLETSLPSYRKEEEDGYYHPYDSTSRISRDRIEIAYRENALFRAFSAFPEGTRFGVFTKQLSNIERLSKTFPNYVFVPPLTNEKVNCVLYNPYDRFEGDVDVSNMDSLIQAIKDKWVPWSQVKHCIFGINNLQVPVGFESVTAGGFYLVAPHRPRFFFSTRSKGSNIMFITPKFSNKKERVGAVFIRQFEDLVRSMFYVSVYRNHSLTDLQERNNSLKAFWYVFLNSVGKGIDFHMNFLMPFFLASPIYYDRKFGIKKNKGKPHAPDLVRSVYSVLSECEKAREEAFYPKVSRDVLWTMVYDGRLEASVHQKSVFFSIKKKRKYVIDWSEPPPSITVTDNEIIGNPNVSYTVIRCTSGSVKDTIKAMFSLYDYDRGNLLYNSAGQETVKLKNVAYPFSDTIT